MRTSSNSRSMRKPTWLPAEILAVSLFAVDFVACRPQAIALLKRSYLGRILPYWLLGSPETGQSGSNATSLIYLQFL